MENKTKMRHERLKTLGQKLRSIFKQKQEELTHDEFISLEQKKYRGKKESREPPYDPRIPKNPWRL